MMVPPADGRSSILWDKAAHRVVAAQTSVASMSRFSGTTDESSAHLVGLGGAVIPHAHAHARDLRVSSSYAQLSASASVGMGMGMGVSGNMFESDGMAKSKRNMSYKRREERNLGEHAVHSAVKKFDRGFEVVGVKHRNAPPTVPRRGEFSSAQHSTL
jgi:hypothetical protein